MRMVRGLTRAWMPLLVVVVVALGAYAVMRIRATFGDRPTTTASVAYSDDTKPFNPKSITYEISGPPGGHVNVDFLDDKGQPHSVAGASLPWSHTIVTTLPSMSANIVAQGDAEVSTLRCRVIVDDRVRDDRSSVDYQPFIYCLVKAV